MYKNNPYAPPSGKEARVFALKQGPLNETELRNLADYVQNYSDMMYRNVMAERLRLLAEHIEHQNPIDGRCAGPYYTREYVLKLQRTIADLAEQVEKGSGATIAFNFEAKGANAQQVAADVALSIALELGAEVADVDDDDTDKPEVRIQTTPKTLESVVAELASQPDIAAYLKGQGIKGQRVNPFSCPVARYVSRELGVTTGYPDKHVSSTTTRIAVRGPKVKSFPPIVLQVVDAPSRVSAFIADFDRGAHPELDETQPA